MIVRSNRATEGENRVEDLGTLSWGKAIFFLEAQEEAPLPPYVGSTLRGALGVSLRRVGCPLRSPCPEPASCLLRERCPYAYCFETPLPAGSERLKNFQAVPHPFLLEPPPPRKEPWQRGEWLPFSLLLIGKAVEFFPYFVVAIAQMAEHGLGKKKYPFRLREVRAGLAQDEDWPLWRRGEDTILSLPTTSFSPDNPENPPRRATLSFVTPLRLVEKKRQLQKIPFRSFARALLGRLSSLLYFHCGQELDIDFRALLAQAEEVQTLEDNLSPYLLSRWSSRQQTKLRLDGLSGDITWEGEAIATLWPALRLGEILHVGKGNVFGLGRYTLQRSP